MLVLFVNLAIANQFLNISKVGYIDPNSLNSTPKFL